MRIVVLMKPTPDITKVRFNVKTGTLERGSVELEINPFDLHAIEEAVRLKERFGGSVTLISMAPPHAERALRDAIARGVDRAVLLSDRRFAGADTLATSRALAAAIRRLGDYDLVICGEKSVDGDTGQVCPEVAEHLGIPHASYVAEVRSIDGSSITVVSDLGPGYYLIKLRLPAAISVTREINTPRKPRFRDLMRARRARIEVWTLDSLKSLVDEAQVGLRGSPTRVAKAYYALAEGRRTVVVRGVEEGVKRIVEVLRREGVV